MRGVVRRSDLAILNGLDDSDRSECWRFKDLERTLAGFAEPELYGVVGEVPGVFHE